MKTKSLTAIALTVLLLVAQASLPVSARAQVPQIINYQGRVIAGGTNFDGTGQFKFALVSGGTNTASQATAVANLSGGFVTSYTVTSGGTNYVSTPSVSVAGGGGSGATAVSFINAYGVVTNVSPLSAGSGYTSPPTVTIDPPPASIAWSNGVNTVSIPVTKGLYSVLLGDTTIPNMTASIPPTVFDNSDVRLRVFFNDGVNGLQQLSPDQRLGAVGYALKVAGGFTWQVINGTSQQAQPNNGYVATDNVARVTVTLPAAPNVGDRVRVSGPGAGGWKIAQNAGQSVLGANTVSGPPGVTWTARDSSRNWNSVASSADGTKLVAEVSLGQIYTSTDSGVTWTPRDSNRDWYRVASSADGTKLVAVVAGGQIYTSTDSGVTWTARDSSRNWSGVASSADGTKLVAVANLGQIYTSTDSGVTWTPRDSNRDWYPVASSADGTKLVATVYGGQIYTSTDSGVTWTARDSNRNWLGVASSADGTKLVATDNGGQIYTSTDSGVTWTARDSNRNWRGVASSADGTKLVAGDFSGRIYTSVPSIISTTTVGTAGYLTGGQGAAIELQYGGNNQFFPLSSAGSVIGL